MAKLTGKYLDDIFVQDSGSGNGATTTFSLSQTPQSQTSINVFVNGLKQRLTNDYTVNLGAGEITFVTAPANAQEINITYVRV